MLRPMHMMKGYKLAANDGEFGRVKDFLFEDQHWTVRYLVADTDRWIPHRKILISPVTLGAPDWEQKNFEVNMTREQIEKQPDLDSDAPVSRLHERAWYASYGYDFWGYGAAPVVPFPGAHDGRDALEDAVDESTHLRSLEEVRGYELVATDGSQIGQLDDMILDDETWAIRYFSALIDGPSSSRTVLLSPQWFDSFDWTQKKLSCRFTKEIVMLSPAFQAQHPITATAEKELYDYYGEPASWLSVSGQKEP